MKTCPPITTGNAMFQLGSTELSQLGLWQFAEDIVTPDGEIAREPYQGDWHD